jgi:hypothetical protein
VTTEQKEVFKSQTDYIDPLFNNPLPF